MRLSLKVWNYDKVRPMLIHEDHILSFRAFWYIIFRLSLNAAVMYYFPNCKNYEKVASYYNRGHRECNFRWHYQYTSLALKELLIISIVTCPWIWFILSYQNWLKYCWNIRLNLNKLNIISKNNIKIVVKRSS